MTEINHELTLGFIGLGKLGLPCSEKFAEYFSVLGYDLIDKSDDVKKVKFCDNLESVVEKSDILFIAVATPHHEEYDGKVPTRDLPAKNFDYSHVLNVLTKLDATNVGNRPVVLISTVLPGTIRNDLIPKLSKNWNNLIYNPFLIAMGTEVEDLVNPEMVILGNSNGQRDEGIDTLINIYQKLIQKDFRIELGTWEEAESIKIFYNTFISAKLSLVNMILDVANNLGHMNVDVVTNALANSTDRIMSSAYMKAGLGDGGPCHPRDNIALSFLAESLELEYDLFGSIIHSREMQAKGLARYLANLGRSVCILGKSFKPGVAYTDGSYSLLIAHFLESFSIKVSFEDSPDPQADVFLLAHRGEFYDYPFPKGAIIVDPWREFPKENGFKVYYYGNSR